MKYILDTHVFLWISNGEGKLSDRVASIVESRSNSNIISMCSIWEMAIKFNLGKIKLNLKLPNSYDFESFIRASCYLNRFEIVNIELDETILNSSPHLHHRDPFDRLLIAQSLVYGIPILSKDEIFDQYGVERIW